MSRTVFCWAAPLTGHNWAAPLLIDRTLLQRLLILALLLISGNVHPNPGPIRNNPRPKYPCSSCILMWAETPFSVLLASSGYTSIAPPSPVLKSAQSEQLALQWFGVAWGADPKVKLAPYSDQFPRYVACILSTLSPRVLPTTTWL